MGIVLGWWMSRRIVDGVLRSSAESTALYVKSFLEPHVQKLMPGEMLSEEELASLDASCAILLNPDNIISVKIWRPDGVIIYSSLRNLIGHKFATTELAPALLGETKGYLNALEEEENEVERQLNIPSYEVYVPLYHKNGKIVAVGEFYQNAKHLEEEVAGSVTETWIAVAIATLTMFLLLSSIVYRGSLTIERQKAALRTRLIQQAKLHRANSALQERVLTALNESARIDEQIQRRIGAELHDGPTQLLALLLLRLDEIEAMLGRKIDSSRSHALIETVKHAAADALKDIRAISTGLFLPTAEPGASVLEIVQSIIRNHEQRTKSDVTFEAGSFPDRLPAEIVRCICRVTQEALTNAYKHAGAKGQRVSISVKNGQIRLIISDQGPGLMFGVEASHDQNSGLGLHAMRYRLEAVGGTLEAQSLPNTGTTLICVIPCAPH